MVVKIQVGQGLVFMTSFLHCGTSKTRRSDKSCKDNYLYSGCAHYVHSCMWRILLRWKLYHIRPQWREHPV